MATSTRTHPGALSDASHGSPVRQVPAAKPGFLPLALVIAAVAVTTAIVAYFLVDTRPASSLLTFPETASPKLPGAPQGLDADSPAPTADALAAELDGIVNASPLKGKTTMTVLDGFTGDTLYETGGGEAATPASSTKVATAAAALAARGSGYRIPTRVVAGDNDGEVVLVAGGDVMLSADGDGFFRGAASLTDMAEQVTESLDGEKPAKLIVDLSIFADDPVAPGVPAADVSAGYTTKLEPIMLDGGRSEPAHGSRAARYDEPAAAAAQVLADKLGGVPVANGTASDDAEELGVVYSPTMQRLAEFALVTSDNLLADALARQTALAEGKEASFAGGVEATVDVLSGMDVPTEGVDLADGSGLSLDNRLTSNALAAVVYQAASGDHPEASGIFAGFPVAGYSGALDDRYDDAEVVGKVRAKTGTLSKVNSLTGLAVTKDGHLLTFSIIFNGKGNGAGVEAAIDAAASVLSRCGCR